MNDEDVERVRMAGRLHDIGKIGVRGRGPEQGGPAHHR